MSWSSDRIELTMDGPAAAPDEDEDAAADILLSGKPKRLPGGPCE